MATKVFFSWQSDTPNPIGRSFLDRALTAALAKLSDDGELQEAARDLELDRDTKGVAGSPPLVDTIFRKIDEAAAVVCDMTFVSSRAGDKKSPNPNVLIEYGWALKAHGHGRVISVMNAAFGTPSEVTLPFDMRHLRFPITYDLPADPPPEKKAAELKALTAKFVEALKPILATEQPATDAFDPRPHGSSPGRWTGGDYELGTIGVTTRALQPPRSPLVWLRLWPAQSQAREWSNTELRAEAWEANSMRAFGATSNMASPFRGAGYFGVFVGGIGPDEDRAIWSTTLFATGEIWGIDGQLHEGNPRTLWVDRDRWRFGAIELYNRLRGLGVQGAIHWEAGFEGCRGRHFLGRGPPSHVEVIRAAGAWEGAETAENIYLAMHAAVLDATT